MMDTVRRAADEVQAVAARIYDQIERDFNRLAWDTLAGLGFSREYVIEHSEDFMRVEQSDGLVCWFEYKGVCLFGIQRRITYEVQNGTAGVVVELSIVVPAEKNTAGNTSCPECPAQV